MLNHGISTGALFLLVGFLYERRHTREMADYGGLAKTVPVLAAVFLIVTLSSIGLPGTNGFVGEFLILAGTCNSNARARPPGLPAPRALGVILGAVYMLWMYQRVFFGPSKRDENQEIADLSGREWAVLAPLAALIVLMGVSSPAAPRPHRARRPAPGRSGSRSDHTHRGGNAAAVAAGAVARCVARSPEQPPPGRGCRATAARRCLAGTLLRQLQKHAPAPLRRPMHFLAADLVALLPELLLTGGALLLMLTEVFLRGERRGYQAVVAAGDCGGGLRGVR